MRRRACTIRVRGIMRSGMAVWRGMGRIRDGGDDDDTMAMRSSSVTWHFARTTVMRPR